MWEPWATLCVTGIKQYETRGYPPMPRVLGQRVAIHAAQRRVTPEEFNPLALEAVSRALGTHSWDDAVTYGAVLGTVGIQGAYRIDYHEAGMHMARICKAVGDVPRSLGIETWIGTDLLGDYSPGRWAWVLSDPERFDPPYPARGYQGWWKWTKPTLPAA